MKILLQSDIIRGITVALFSVGATFLLILPLLIMQLLV